MKNLPPLLAEISANPLLGRILNEYYIDTSLIPTYDAIDYTSLIDKLELENFELKKVIFHAEIQNKKSFIRFMLEGTEYFKKSDHYFLNEHFDKKNSWVVNHKDSKSYCYSDKTSFIEVSVHDSDYYYDGTRIEISCEPLDPKFKKEKNLIFEGELFFGESQEGFFTLTVEKSKRQLSKKEIEEIFKNMNLDTREIIEKRSAQKYEIIKGLDCSEFFHPERQIQRLYYSNEILEKFKSAGLIEGNNDVSIEANITWYNDSDIIIDEIISCKLIT